MLFRSDIRAAHAASVPFLMLMGVLCGAWQMARSSAAAKRLLSNGGADPSFLEAKVATARFYAEHILPRAKGLRDEVIGGAASVLALSEEQF